MPGNIPDDPTLAIIVVAPNGDLYKVASSQWSDQNNLITDPQQKGTVQQLANLGTYLASIPDDFAAGAGVECIVLNVAKIVPGKGGSGGAGGSGSSGGGSSSP